LLFGDSALLLGFSEMTVVYLCITGTRCGITVVYANHRAVAVRRSARPSIAAAAAAAVS